MDIEQILKALRLNEEEESTFKSTYDRVFEEVSDHNMAMSAALGAISRLKVGLEAKSLLQNKNGILIGGWAITFGDEKHKDADAVPVFFDEGTEFFLDYYPQAPLWIEHGRNSVFKSREVGYRTSYKVSGQGVWLEHFIPDNLSQYAKIRADISNGMFSYSTETFPGHALNGYDSKTGRHGVWPIVGTSLTRMPAEPGNGPVVIVEEFQKQPDPNTKFDKQKEGDSEMDPEQLQAAADWLGVDATPEAVMAALEEMMGMIASVADAEASKAEGEEEELPEEIEEMKRQLPEQGEMKEALGLSEKNGWAEVLEELKAMKALLVEQPEDDEKNELDYGRLSDFRKSMAEKAANKVPANTRDGESPMNYGKSRSLGAPAHHKPRYVFHQWVVDAIAFSKGQSIKSFKAQNYEVGPLGGFTLRPDIVEEEILPLLREDTVLDRLNVTYTEVPDNASYIRNKMKSAPTAYWFAANDGPTESESQFESIQATPKGLGAFTLIPRYMIDKSPASVQTQIENEIVRSIALKRDLSAFTGTGAVSGSDLGREPVGLDNITNVNALAVSGVPSYSDFIDAKGLVEDDNVELTDAGAWVSHGRDIRTVKQLVDTTGRPLYMEDFADGKKQMFVDGDPMTRFNQLPKTLGSGADSVIYFGEWRFFEVVQSQSLEFFTFNEKYMNNLQIGIMAWTFVDFLVHYPEAFVRMTGIQA